MAITDIQKTDFLWKKLGYGVAKTDTDTNKKAYEESISSPLLIRGDKIWQESGSIPTTKPTATSSLVTIYKDGTGAWSPTVKTAEDTTASDNKTWKTNLTDWISPEFGATYQVEVYIDTDSAANPQTTGTKIFAAGSGNNDEWFFDYQAGVLHFIGANIPTAITTGVTGKSIYVSGARYAGVLGLGTSASANIGNLVISGNTISTTSNGNIILDPNGTGNVTIVGDLITDKILTDNYYYANGVALDMQQPAGSNTQLQFNSSNNFGASANLTFDTATSKLTVVGNIEADYLLGDGGFLSNIISTSGVATTVTDAAQPNVTSVGTTLTIGSAESNTYIDNGNITAAGNLVINGGNISLGGAVLAVSGAGAGISVGTDTIVDSFAVADFRTAKYIIKAGNDLGYQSIEVLMIHDGANSYITVYGAISTVDYDDIITISSNVVSGNVKLYATGSAANTVVNFLSTYVKD